MLEAVGFLETPSLDFGETISQFQERLAQNPFLASLL